MLATLSFESPFMVWTVFNRASHSIWLFGDRDPGGKWFNWKIGKINVITYHVSLVKIQLNIGYRIERRMPTTKEPPS